VHDGDVAALDLQAARGLEAQQPAADDDGFDAGPRSAEELARIVERTEDEDAVGVEAADRREPRGAAGGQQQRVVRRHAAVVAGHRLCLGIDIDDAYAEAERDVVLAIPVERVDDDVVGRPLAREHRRQHDAVVVDVRLVAEDGDRELRRVLQDLLDARHPRHPVADDDEAFHAVRSTRTADCL
jgi:hypothetical protein